MARPTKQGIDYFPVDVDFDDKIEMYLLEKESLGLAVLVTLWQLIYKNEGYYIQNGNDLLLMVKKRISGDINSIKDCINLCLDRNIFDKNLYEKHKILTSRGIQKRFFDAATKKKEVRFNPKFMLIDVSGYGNLIKVDDNSINSYGNATKEKEEVKEKEEEEIYQKPTLENIKQFCLENNISLELAAKFYSFYETQDWMVYNKQGRATVDLKQNNRWAKKLNEWNLEELKNGIAKHKSGIAADTLREIAESIANDPDLKD